MKKEMKSLETLAYEQGLELVTVTHGVNGYPKDLEKGIKGFGSFAEAEKLAADNPGLEIVSLRRRDGWNFWQEEGRVWEPYDMLSISFSDDCAWLRKADINNFFENEVAYVMDGMTFHNFDELKAFVSKKEEIYNELEDAEDDEVVLTCEGRYHGTFKEKAMRYCEDVYHYEIGVVDTREWSEEEEEA